MLLADEKILPESPSWVVLQYEDEGRPFVMKAMETLPPDQDRARFPWLTVIGWHYADADATGFPEADTLAQMERLEEAVETLEQKGLCRFVYSKTGQGQREFVYYIGDRDVFMTAFNEALSGQPRYPLEIEFFEDPDWRDLSTVQDVYLQQG